MLVQYGHRKQGYNFCAFTARFRRRFALAQKRRGAQRPHDEFWISVHFRWGDTASADPDNNWKSDMSIRSGATLSEFAAEAA